jgi:hypothetical protein
MILLTRECFSPGYKYIAVYFPLVILQWVLAYKCESRRSIRLTVACTNCLLFHPSVMVEVRGLTLEQISEVFDGPGSFTSHVHHQHLGRDEVESGSTDPFADEVVNKDYSTETK